VARLELARPLRLGRSLLSLCRVRLCLSLSLGRPPHRLFCAPASSPVARAALRFNFQTARLRCASARQAKRHRPYSLRPRVGRLPARCAGPSSYPSKNRGGGAPSGAPVFGLAALHCRERGRLSALHSGFSVPGAVTSGRGRGPAGPPIRQAFARLRPRRVQPVKAAPRSRGGRRPLVVGADGGPRPPGSGVTSPARRRRIPPR